VRDLHAECWIDGRYQLVHKSLDPPRPQAAAPVPIPAATTAPTNLAIYSEGEFIPVQPVDSAATTEAERMDMFAQVCPKPGREVRYIVSNAEVAATTLRPGQQYSVYPKQFSRSEESRVKTARPVQPLRVEGPMISLQWALANSKGNSGGLSFHHAIRCRPSTLHGESLPRRDFY
jgi:hypothetical protein